MIPSIGVDTEIQEATLDNYEQALRKGVWRVSDFGAPGENGMPVIVAAHRYGYLAWSNSFRRENSFFNLPKLKVGDTVQIVWHQRKYTYEIYAEGKGKDIMDYTANLILYTCENLTGEERVFKYARLLEV
jgi:sortase (surface protein transpeptidase)